LLSAAASTIRQIASWGLAGRCASLFAGSATPAPSAMAIAALTIVTSPQPRRMVRCRSYSPSQLPDDLRRNQPVSLLSGPGPESANGAVEVIETKRDGDFPSDCAGCALLTLNSKWSSQNLVSSRVMAYRTRHCRTHHGNPATPPTFPREVQTP